MPGSIRARDRVWRAQHRGGRRGDRRRWGRFLIAGGGRRRKMKTSWLRVMGALLGTVGIGLGLVAGCGQESTGGDSSETHFLARCTDSCGGGLECLCGVCTKTCTQASGCGELDPSASCEDSCSASATKVCDMPC